MIFAETELRGSFLIRLELKEDQRGSFARSFCREEFEAHGLDPRVAQCSISFNPLAGTLRGLHFQRPPFQEAKLVRCTSGAIYDVAVDLRPGSPTFGRHLGVELDARNRAMLYIPEGCAHGYQTLEDDTEVFYQMSAPYAAHAQTGVRWDDPAFGIRWPREVRVISPRDQDQPDFSGAGDPRIQRGFSS